MLRSRRGPSATASSRWRWVLRIGLLAGGAYEIGVAVAMALAPRLLARSLAVPLPEPGFYRWVLIALLAGFGALSLLAADDTHRYREAIWVLGSAKVAAGLALFAAAFGFVGAQGTSPLGLHNLGAVDLLFGASHIVPLAATRR